MTTRQDDDATHPGEARADDAPDSVGGRMPARVGQYVLERELGRGGMGIVYVARDERLDRSVALKALSAAGARDPESLSALEREAKHLASISDPNVATIHGIEQSEGTLWLVLELVEGRSLAEILRDGRLPVDRGLGLGLQIASGLNAAHRCGIVHCDLKPSNVRVTPAGVVKIVDFGLARRDPRAAGTLDAKDGKSARRLSGSPGYMSPEQVRGEAAGPRSDAWAFGCVLFEMLAARPAFPGKSVAERLDATLSREPDWSALPEDLAPPVAALLRSCLAREPAVRLDDLSVATSTLASSLGASGQAAPSVAALRTETNLPVGLSSFVGRDAAIAEVDGLLSGTGAARIVTLTGAGGCGKTRLAVEVARRLLPRLEGAWLVELAALGDAAHVPPAVATALGVKDAPGRTLLDGIAARLCDRRVLVILDNCEHLLSSCAGIADALLSACPRLVLLCTSREPLGLAGEQVYRVPSLSLPPAGPEIRTADLERHEATRLFLERARLVRPGFEPSGDDVGQIVQACRRLDGIPLAIELAAARLSSLSVRQIVERLDDRFRLLAGGSRMALPRQQALRATLDWSHDLLSETERILFRRLAVFAGTFTLSSAEQVGGLAPLDAGDVLEILARLVDKSLVTVADRPGQARYRLLETIRQYARDRLVESGEAEAIRRRHRDHYVALAEAGRARPESAAHGPWVEQLAIEHDNLRAVLEWCASDPGSVEAGYRLATSLRWLWQRHGFWTEGREILHALLAADGIGAVTLHRCGALNAAGVLARAQGDYAEAQLFLEEALAGFRELSDDAGAAAALENLAGLAYLRGETTLARERSEEALALRTRLSDRAGMAACLQTLGLIAIEEGEHARAKELLTRCLAIRREMGDARGIAMALGNLAMVVAESGDPAGAIPIFVEAAARLRASGDREHLADALNNLGKMHLLLGDVDAALAFVDESAAIARELGNPRALTYSLANQGCALLAKGRLAAARSAFRESLQFRREMGPRQVAEILEFIATLAVADGMAVEAARLLGAAAEIRTAPSAKASPVDLRDVAAPLAAARATLGDEAFEAAMDEGRALSQEEAIRIAGMVVEGA